MNDMKNSKPRLFIIGASGHGKVVAEIARLNNYEDIVFLDDNDHITECAGYPVIGRTDESGITGGHVCIAIGNASIRERLFRKYSEEHMPALIHPKAVISESASIGDGTVVMAGAVVNADTIIGKGCIINTSATVDHDCILGDFTHVAVGAHLCGTVNVGNKTWIGAGATVINNIDITDECLIGAGAVVTRSIDRMGIYIGVPAKRLVQESE